MVCLYAEVEPAKFERAALRWHARFVTETSPSLLRAQISLPALGELRVGSEAAEPVLLALAERIASSGIFGRSRSASTQGRGRSGGEDVRQLREPLVHVQWLS